MDNFSTPYFQIPQSEPQPAGEDEWGQYLDAAFPADPPAPQVAPWEQYAQSVDPVASSQQPGPSIEGLKQFARLQRPMKQPPQTMSGVSKISIPDRPVSASAPKRPGVMDYLKFVGDAPSGGSSSASRSTARIIPGQSASGLISASTRSLIDATDSANDKMQMALAENQAAMRAAQIKKQWADEENISLRNAETSVATLERDEALAENAKIRAQLEAEEPDPDRYFKREGAFGNAMMALSAGLAGFVQGFNRQGGQNPVIAQIERAVDRDIALQEKQQARRLEGNREAKTGILDKFRERFDNAERAHAQYKIFALEKYQNALELIEMQSKNAQQQQAAAQMRMQIQQRHDELMLDDWAKQHPAIQVSESRSFSGGEKPKSMADKILKAAQVKAAIDAVEGADASSKSAGEKMPLRRGMANDIATSIAGIKTVLRGMSQKRKTGEEYRPGNKASDIIETGISLIARAQGMQKEEIEKLTRNKMQEIIAGKEGEHDALIEAFDFLDQQVSLLEDAGVDSRRFRLEAAQLKTLANTMLKK